MPIKSWEANRFDPGPPMGSIKDCTNAPSVRKI